MNTPTDPHQPFEIVDHVEGLAPEDLEPALKEAETGYNLEDYPTYDGPASALIGLPQELRAAIMQQAITTGKTPNAIVEEAVTEHFHRLHAA